MRRCTLHPIDWEVGLGTPLRASSRDSLLGRPRALRALPHPVPAGIHTPSHLPLDASSWSAPSVTWSLFNWGEFWGTLCKSNSCGLPPMEVFCLTLGCEVGIGGWGKGSRKQKRRKCQPLDHHRSQRCSAILFPGWAVALLQWVLVAVTERVQCGRGMATVEIIPRGIEDLFSPVG